MFARWIYDVGNAQLLARAVWKYKIIAAMYLIRAIKYLFRLCNRNQLYFVFMPGTSNNSLFYIM